MAGPSIKGSAFEGVIADLRALLEHGALSRGELEARLQAEDLAYLDEKILHSSWYPIESYRRLVELLRDMAGGGRDAYLEQRGEEAAQRLADAGVYQQLDYVKNRTGTSAGSTVEAELDQLARSLRLILTLWRTLFNFGAFAVERADEPGRLLVIVTDAEALPEVAVKVIQGFMNRATELARGERAYGWEGRRESPERVVYRMRRPVR